MILLAPHLSYLPLILCFILWGLSCFVLIHAHWLLYKLAPFHPPPQFSAISESGSEEEAEPITMIKLRSKRSCRGNSKLGSGGGNGVRGREKGEIKWELRPGGMLVQKRETAESEGEGMITVRVSTVSKWHEIPIESTSTFGELKMVLSLVTGLEPREQRLLFKGKEREDCEYLHMVGVRDKDKVLLLEDPAIRERKLHALTLHAVPLVSETH